MQVDLHNGSKKALVVVYTETGPPETPGDCRLLQARPHETTRELKNKHFGHA